MLGIPKRSALPGKFPLHFAANQVRESLRPAVLMWKPPSVQGTPSTRGGSVPPSACSWNASSTAAMQASRSSSACTSARASSSVSFVRASTEEAVKVHSRLDLDGGLASLEDAGARAPREPDGSPFDAQHRPLAQAHDCPVVLLEVLQDP